MVIWLKILKAQNACKTIISFIQPLWTDPFYIEGGLADPPHLIGGWLGTDTEFSIILPHVFCYECIKSLRKGKIRLETMHCY